MPIGLCRTRYVLAALPLLTGASALKGRQGFDGARLQRDAEGHRNFDDLRRDLARGTVGAVSRGTTLSPTCP